ncbi:MAG: hypothetical protein GYA61_02975 [Spirochaetales bacterium]|nr:hypothetical protein [Spirochaetales bacterium]
MKLNSSFEASFLKENISKNNKSFPLELGKIYKANILFSKGNNLYFSINDLVFKTSFINTSSKSIYLKVIANSERYKFELIKENVLYEKTENNQNNLLNMLKEKFSQEVFDNILKNSFYDLAKENVDNLILILQNSTFTYNNSKYDLLLKIQDDNWLYIEFTEFEPSSYSFSLNFELDGKKFISVKGYYKKKENKVICNFITNSLDFYRQSFKADEELTSINKNYRWLCKQRFEENISL